MKDINKYIEYKVQYELNFAKACNCFEKQDYENCKKYLKLADEMLNKAVEVKYQ